MTGLMRRALVAVVAAVAYTLVVALPTAMIDNPLFSREIPPTWWSWPALVVSAALAGLLAATYVAPARAAESADTADAVDTIDVPARGGLAGGLLTFFAVGCPVCNKLVLFALGTSGALAWFEPVQPLLVLAGIAVLAWALRRRVSTLTACPAPAASTSTHSGASA